MAELLIITSPESLLFLDDKIDAIKRIGSSFYYLFIFFSHINTGLSFFLMLFSLDKSWSQGALEVKNSELKVIKSLEIQSLFIEKFTRVKINF